MNQDAGRGGHLVIPLHLEGGVELPFLVDTGAPIAVLDKSLASQLGQCLGTDSLWNFGAKYEASRYAAPRLYLGNTPLITDSNTLASDFIGKLSARLGRPVMGILGMDCLQHYCVQLDFRAGKMRFLDPNRLKTAKLGQAFPMELSSNGQGDPQWYRLFIRQSNLAGGEETDLLVDTGCSDDGLLKPGPFRRELEEQRWRMPVDAAPDPEPNVVDLPECVWNGATYTNLWLGNGSAAVERGSGESSLGLRFLARHLVTFDFPKQTMYLKQTSIGPLGLDEPR